MFNTIYICINSISFMYWLDLIMLSLITWSNLFLLIRLHWVQSYDSNQLIYIWRIKRIEFQSLFRITFNYIDSDVPTFTFHVEDDEIRSQSCPNEHDWFSPYLTKNTQG